MITYSRYDFMKDGSTVDEKTGSFYPDPLSLNYLDFQLTDTPAKDLLSDPQIIFFWNEARRFYGIAGYDDIVLTLNNIAHKNFLNSSDEIYFPKLEDIQNSFGKTE